MPTFSACKLMRRLVEKDKKIRISSIIIWCITKEESKQKIV